MLVFVYFFVAAGLTLLLLNILNAINRPNKTLGGKIRVGIVSIIGVGLASVAAVVNTNAGFAFAQSPWVLPTVALTFVVGMISFFLCC
jgi:hypothetical protein